MIRTLDGSAPLSENAILHGQLLIDLEVCSIHPITNREAWQAWENIIEELEATDEMDGFVDFGENGTVNLHDQDDDEFYDPDDDDNSDYLDEAPGMRRIPHGMAISTILFNVTAIRINPTNFESSRRCAPGRCTTALLPIRANV